MDFVIKPFITSPQPLSTPLPVTMAEHVTDTPVRRPMDKDEKMYTFLLSLFSSNADACANCRLFVYVYDLLVKRGLTRTAQALLTEANLKDEAPIPSKNGFLYE